MCNKKHESKNVRALFKLLKKLVENVQKFFTTKQNLFFLVPPISQKKTSHRKKLLNNIPLKTFRIFYSLLFPTFL